MIITTPEILILVIIFLCELLLCQNDCNIQQNRASLPKILIFNCEITEKTFHFGAATFIENAF